LASVTGGGVEASVGTSAYRRSWFRRSACAIDMIGKGAKSAAAFSFRRNAVIV
jgi:hypothetical protein